MLIADDSVRVLVVEDEESYREALLMGLTKEGYAVELAADGLEGLRMFSADPPDIVLLDVLLPGMNGTEVCRRMRELAPVPVIMVTALRGDGLENKARASGSVCLIKKPFQTDALVGCLQQALRT